MFDLDQAMAEWRRQMTAGGITSSHVLEELESHLRDDVEQQMRSGSTERQAFETAVRQIGTASVLEGEFDKVGGTREAPARVKEALLTLAGIPNLYLANPMTTSGSNLEPRWATYLKAAGFLTPAVFLWSLAAVFAVPKLQAICRDAGLPDLPNASGFWGLTRTNFMITLFFREHWAILAGAILGVVLVLEWRSTRWPRYRRATVGFGAFLLNAVVLVSIFMMIITAIAVVPALFPHAK
jgi:hypothetical protein